MLSLIGSNLLSVQFGERAVIDVAYTESDPDNLYQYSVFDTTKELFMSDEGVFDSVTPVLFDPVPLVHHDDVNMNIFEAVVNTSAFQSYTLLVVKFEQMSGDGDTDELNVYVRVGYIPASNEAQLVEVWGVLRDAYGNGIPNAAVTFTVLNKAGYFDNMPATSLVANAVTDSQGKFSVRLNRNYDYVLSIAALNYVKSIKLSTLPSGVSSVEVDLGSGLGC